MQRSRRQDPYPLTWEVPLAEHHHLVHEIAVLADQRHRAGTALTRDALEDSLNRDRSHLLQWCFRA